MSHGTNRFTCNVGNSLLLKECIVLDGLFGHVISHVFTGCNCVGFVHFLKHDIFVCFKPIMFPFIEFTGDAALASAVRTTTLEATVFVKKHEHLQRGH